MDLAKSFEPNWTAAVYVIEKVFRARQNGSSHEYLIKFDAKKIKVKHSDLQIVDDEVIDEVDMHDLEEEDVQE